MWIGVTLSLCGQTGAIYGMLVQKSALNDDKLLGCKWWIGLLIFVTFELVTSLALKFAPASVMSSIQSFQLVINALFAPLILPGERLTATTTIGCGFLLIACTCAVLAYPDEKSPDITPFQLSEMLRRAWVILMLVTLVLIFFGLACRAFFQIRKGTAPDLFSIGILTAVSATSTTICIKSMFEVWSSSGSALIVFLSCATVILSLGSFGFTNVAFRYYEALSVVPICNSLTQVMRVIVSGLIFNEFLHLSAWRLSVFFTCVAFVVATTFLLSIYTLHEERELHIELEDRVPPSLEQALTADVDEMMAAEAASSSRPHGSFATPISRALARTMSRDFVQGISSHNKDWKTQVDQIIRQKCGGSFRDFCMWICV
eukprot:GEMP01021503.1.p1 GENE.GEMP01021503.1~~GEMP01021503.1.p1  ORF type:complete len:373 (+),score=48.20 GEMP01021503.1:175-1293(+)